MMMKETMVSWKTLYQTLSHSTPQLSECLQQLSVYPQIDTPNAWCQHFKNRLALIGFPCEYPLDSVNYQYVHRFMRLFDDLMSLNAITTQMTQQEAINTVITLSRSTVFQIKKPMSSIMILGILEASGCPFDSIWISGLTDHCLPQKTRFSPFIPVRLQKKYQFPHTSPQKELKWAKHLLDRFESACNQLIVSYPAFINDIPQRSCSFIKYLPLLETKTSVTRPPVISLKSYEESYQIPPRIDETLSGGTSLLASQAKCPFQAFAAYRLQARSAPETSDGPDPMERGQLIHQVMESVWRGLGRQAMLLTIAPAVLETLIEDSIDSALKPLRQSRSQSFPLLVQEVEKERLKQLVHANLAWEKQRPSFEIAALEQQYTLTLASIPFKVRIDRIDNVTSERDSTQVVIDYKSSLPAYKPWHEERPEAPQLLLYALLDPQITALLFMELKTGRMTMNGITDAATPLPEITTLKSGEHWSDYQQRWKNQLTNLALEIQSGRCDPAPNRISQCGLCSFQTLCRVE
jgi:probable DNA repair protein